MKLTELLEERALPAVEFPSTATGWWQRHGEISRILCREAYGQLPPPPLQWNAVELAVEERFCAGKAPLHSLRLMTTLPRGQFSFPVSLALPFSDHPCPVIVYISFRPNFPDKYLPVEELTDRGYAVASFCYTDITADNSDFQDGLAAVLQIDRSRPDATGKLMLWAWAAMRVQDYLRTLPEIDRRNICVAGHSRLAKAALLAAGLDTRFSAVLANEPGCMGGALTRGKAGETLEDVCESFPYFFCPNLQSYIGREREMPFDQHFLLALTAPRKLYIASAAQDLWADPVSEFLCCAAAHEAWEALVVPGLVGAEQLPKAGECFGRGSLGYHLRAGEHYLSRYEWQKFLDFLERDYNRLQY